MRALISVSDKTGIVRFAKQLVECGYDIISTGGTLTVLQKNGGRLGETGSTAHLFSNCGVIHIQKDKIKEDEIFEIAINAGATIYLSGKAKNLKEGFELAHKVINERITKDFVNSVIND